MEVLIYYSVRLIAAIYILYKLWVWLFRGTGAKLIRNRITVRIRTTHQDPEANPRPAASPVVGVTKTVVLEEPRRGLPSDLTSTDLEPTGYIGSDDDISAEDVESDYQPPESTIPKVEELYEEPDASGYDPELSGGGLTYEQIGEAINVLSGMGTVDEDTKTRARNTLIELRNTDILDMITREVCDETKLEQFMNDSDMSGKVEKPEDIRLRDFDIMRYI